MSIGAEMNGNFPLYRFYATHNVSVSDWSLPSIDELYRIYWNAVSGVDENGDTFTPIGSFAAAKYWSSSEASPDEDTKAWTVDFTDGSVSAELKTETFHVRAVRSSGFANTNIYPLRSTGQGGGIVFYSVGDDYMECALIDQSASHAWSNITDVEVITDTIIGAGGANTLAIIGQAGHTDSAAKHCADLIITEIIKEVFPLKFLESSLTDSREDDNVFYRRTFSGNLLFGSSSFVIDEDGNQQNRRSDWVFFWDIEQNDPCARLDLLITKITEGVSADYWYGYFSTTDGLIDIDNCTFEVIPMQDDDYEEILNYADIQHSIFNAGTRVTTTAYIEGEVDVDYICGLFLMDVIEYLAEMIYDPDSAIGPAAVINSTFFTAATNPVTLDDNLLLYLTIAQKSDIIRPAATNPAQVALMSWNELMEILWVMFQVRWSYDGAGTFTVEHISYFTQAAGLDLRSQLITQGTNKYSYNKEKMPKYEKFAWMEADQYDFVGYDISYDSPCVDQDPKTNVLEKSIRVTTDWELIYYNPDAISDDGFVIFCNRLTGGAYFVKAGCGAATLQWKLNMDLSWANLHNCYYRHNRVMIDGNMNTADITFWSAQKTKKQQCTAFVCDEFDPSEYITTELGETYFGGIKATVDSATIKPEGTIEFDLLYGVEDNVNTGVETVKMARVKQRDTCNAFDVTLTDPAPVGGLVITFQASFYDAGGLICTANLSTLTVPAGDYSDFIDPINTACLGHWPMDPDEWMEVEVIVTTAGWLLEYDLDETCAGM